MEIQSDDYCLLAIDTSCDETSAAVVRGGREVLSNIISSQILLHQKYGGVVPEIASRKHIELIDYVVDEALEKSGKGLKDLDGICVTYGPGLVGALLVGLIYAKALALGAGKPFLGVNHLDGHISSNYLGNSSFQPPFICLVVSGGHTHLVHVKNYGDYETLGKTKDDAAGEAYDKVARTLGLGYPGGPKLEKLAGEGNPNSIIFPRALMEENNFNFSFSGVKSAVLNYMNQAKMKNERVSAADIAAGFQEAVLEVLVQKTVQAALKFNLNQVALAGGVASNTALRRKIEAACKEKNINLHIPEPVYCTDNAAMIGSAGYFQFIRQKHSDFFLNAVPGLKL